jgi:ABC-type antimicrobial peptide transport system permease subunit
VSATSNVPMGGGDGQWAVSADPTVPLSNSSPSAQHDTVWPGYFNAMGIRLIAGRFLDDDDGANRPRVALVNETMARQMWPGVPAVGRQFLAPNGGVRTVVGVVADIRQRGLGVEPRPTLYESVKQLAASRLTLVIRTRSEPGALAAAARTVVLGVDRSALIERVVTMDDLVADSLKTQRFRMLLLEFFGLTALVVTALGLAGVAVHSASVRMRELCLRMAIGATAASVRRLVLAQYAWAIAVGLMIGGLAAAGAGRGASSYLFGVTWYDPASYLGAGAVMAAAAVGAGWLALRRLERANLVTELAG